jgi:hypothetical protein
VTFAGPRFRFDWHVHTRRERIRPNVSASFLRITSTTTVKHSKCHNHNRVSLRRWQVSDMSMTERTTLFVVLIKTLTTAFGQQLRTGR